MYLLAQECEFVCNLLLYEFANLVEDGLSMSKLAQVIDSLIRVIGYGTYFLDDADFFAKCLQVVSPDML